MGLKWEMKVSHILPPKMFAHINWMERQAFRKRTATLFCLNAQCEIKHHLWILFMDFIKILYDRKYKKGKILRLSPNTRFIIMPHKYEAWRKNCLFFNSTIQPRRNKFILCLSINDDLYPYLSILFLSEK